MFSVLVFFFKQKTAYDMRISDWSSDVCSSDLNRAICASLDAEELALLGKLGRNHRVKAGQTLLWEGDDAPVVANVLDGVLKLVVAAADGREQIVGVVFPSDFIGRPFGKESPYSVTAMTDGEVCIRSEEHTSELQSLMRLSYAVFCLKNNNS